MERRDFKGIWIPSFVWLDKELNALDKIILAEIDSLDYEGQGCYATNKYIAEFCQCSESKVSHSISKLIAAGYLKKAIFDGRQRIIKSNLLPQVVVESATTTEERNEPKKAVEKKNYIQECQQIISFLNEKAGTKYRATSKTTQAHISARLNEGFTLDDFLTVIKNKCEDWKGTEFEKYLCPETLFGNKFEKYLNAKVTSRNKKSQDQERDEFIRKWGEGVLAFDDLSNIKV